MVKHNNMRLDNNTFWRKTENNKKTVDIYFATVNMEQHV